MLNCIKIEQKVSDSEHF